MSKQQKPEASPAEVHRLRIAAGMTQKECAELFGIGLRSWQKKEESGTVSSRGITSGEFDLLLLLANEHPDFTLIPREVAARQDQIVRALHKAGERLSAMGVSKTDNGGSPVSTALNWLNQETKKD